MKGYTDLLRESQARQNAERRAEAAEAKLDAIRALPTSDEADGSAWIDADAVLAILDGTP